MKPLYKLLLTIAIGSAVFVGGFFYYHSNTPALQHTNTIDNVVHEQTFEYIRVSVSGDTQKIIDDRSSYTIVVPSDWRVVEEKDGVVLNGLEGEVLGSSGVSGTGCKVVVVETEISNPKEYFNSTCKNDPDCTSVNMVKYNESILAVSKVGSFMGSGFIEYYLAPQREGGMYDRATFLCSDENKENEMRDKILDTFKRVNVK